MPLSTIFQLYLSLESLNIWSHFKYSFKIFSHDFHIVKGQISKYEQNDKKYCGNGDEFKLKKNILSFLTLAITVLYENKSHDGT